MKGLGGHRNCKVSQQLRFALVIIINDCQHIVIFNISNEFGGASRHQVVVIVYKAVAAAMNIINNKGLYPNQIRKLSVSQNFGTENACYIARVLRDSHFNLRLQTAIVPVSSW